MPLKHGILGLLHYGPSSGYDLDKAFKGSLNFFWQAQTSQIYRELNAMEKQGWIKSEVIIQMDKPNKKLFSLTPTGKKELLRWLTANSIKDDIRIRDPFLVKLFFSGQMDILDNIETMKKFKEYCSDELVKINETIKGCPERIEGNFDVFYWGTAASFGRCYYEMCIRWAEDTIKKMEGIR